MVSTPNRRSLPGARRWLAERGVPGIRLSLAPVDRWQTWVDLESHGAAAGLVPVSRRGHLLPPRRPGRLADRPALPLRRAAPRPSSRCRAPPPGGSASTSAWGSGASDLSGDGPPGDGRARRAGVVVAIVALFVLALGVFVLPFAFPTPPPVVTRFNATLLFSPDGDGRREEAKVNVRLSEPAAVTVEVQKDGEHRPPPDHGPQRRRGAGCARTGTAATTTAGVVPGRDLRPQAARPRGQASSSTPRARSCVDTEAPRPAEMTVESATLGRPGPGECRVTLQLARPGVGGVRGLPRGAGGGGDGRERRRRPPAGAAPGAPRRRGHAGAGTGGAPTAARCRRGST